ncbi:MAG: hypothetical protein ACU0BF_02485 [Paracoccaceae bacterium]
MARAQGPSRRAFLLGAPAAVALTGCGAAEPRWAPQAQVAAARYVHPGPPTLTLYTMRRVDGDGGEHTGLMISGRERALYDPAGTFGHPSLPERNDLHFGMTPAAERAYLSYHARTSYYVEIQRIAVSMAQADRAFAAVAAEGAAPKANCAVFTGRALRQVPGFEDIRPTWFPGTLAERFGNRPGVEQTFYRETDSDDLEVGRAELDRVLAAL